MDGTEKSSVMIELPHQEPCELCEGMSERDPRWALIEECRYWGIGPPQLAVFENAGRIRGTSHDPSQDDERHDRVRVEASVLHDTAKAIRACLPG